jgi:hypothetical protein
VPLAIKDFWEKVGKLKNEEPNIKVLDEDEDSLLLSAEKPQNFVDKKVKISCSML